jgi:hypothetical protein
MFTNVNQQTIIKLVFYHNFSKNNKLIATQKKFRSPTVITLDISTKFNLHCISSRAVMMILDRGSRAKENVS